MTPPQPTLGYASPVTPPRKPRSKRINVRLIVFLSIVSFPFVGMLYAFVSYSGGIRHSSEGEIVDLKALGYFTLDKQDGTLRDVPAKWRGLDGKKVVLEGYMWSAQSVLNSNEFQFVYNIQRCCFGGPPQPQERVFVRVPEGRNIQLIDGVAKIIGTLHVKIERNSVDGSIVSVYTMDLDKAEPKS
jgi:hypothetical protein